MTDIQTIYHLSPLSELRAGIDSAGYLPPRFEEDGFVHCTTRPATVLAVASDYFADLAEALIVLELGVARISARVVFEDAAPIDGGGSSHLVEGERFPHVYGAIELDAISGAAILARSNAKFDWPRRFGTLAELLE